MLRPALQPRARHLPTCKRGFLWKEDLDQIILKICESLDRAKPVVAGSLISTQKKMDLSFRRKNLI